MPSAILLISCEVGQEEEVADTLCHLQGVEYVALVYGVYDLAIRLIAGSMEELESLIIKKVRSISGVRSTITLIISRECPTAVRSIDK
ncbi:MAG: Lrp/AsnC family transcriptional regulator [Euryarchaeota archaeon]|nr:Lrp/AsnC family transcriptional regulator [Euryarchaeota archaeon]